MLEEVPALPVGALVGGKLRVVRALGIGGMGTVYEVEHELTRHRRALKLLHAELATNSQAVARFLREASAAGRIGSPHIVETFDAGRLDSGEPYLVMEMLDGQSLGRILDEQGKLAEADALDWIAQACDGAQAAHDAGIIHRDIKPDNLFIQRSGRVKLLDFGISKFDPLLTGEQQLTGDLTLGTPFYMAPEQTSKTSSVDARVDVYALGVVLYECVTGERPFTADTYPQLVVQIHLGDYTPASSISATSALLDGIIAKAMARNPADRFQRPAELAQALRDLAVATERRASQPTPAAAQSPFETTRRVGNLTSLLERQKQPRPVELAATERSPDAEMPLVAAQPARAEPQPAAVEPARGRPGNEPTLVSASEPPAAPAAKKPSSSWKLAALAAVLAALASLAWARAGTSPDTSPVLPSASAADVAAVSAPSTLAGAPLEPTSAPTSFTSAAASTSAVLTGSAAPVVALPSSKPAKPGSRAQEHELEQANPLPMITPRLRHARLLCCAFALFIALEPGNAAADDAGRAEARARFDRGLTLFNQGDNQGALAEFQAAYQLTGNATVLYNIARVQAAAGEPVAALETVDKLVAEPGDLSPARREQLQALRQEQLQRVGSVTIRAVGVTEARLEIDGADAGVLDPTRPLRLAAGRHVIGVLAPAHHPLRKTVLVAGQQQKALEFAPEPLEGALGRLRFALEPVDVAVLLDGQELGKSPNLVEVAVAPGRHRLALERAGYRRVERDIVVPEAGTLEVSEKLGFDPASRAGHDGRISVSVSEEDAVMFVNGAVTSAARSVALPEGQHRLRVERAGFVPSERTIVVRRGSSSVIDVTLAPTADYRADYTSSAQGRRTWALGLAIGGVAVTGAATGYLWWNGEQITTAENDFEHAERAAAAACDVEQTVDCDESLQVAQIRLDDLGDKRDRQVLGWIGLGVGAAALATGVVLWVTGKDPLRYEPKPESDVFGSLSLTPWSNGRDAAGLVVGIGSN